MFSALIPSKGLSTLFIVLHESNFSKSKNFSSVIYNKKIKITYIQ